MKRSDLMFSVEVASKTLFVIMLFCLSCVPSWSLHKQNGSMIPVKIRSVCIENVPKKHHDQIVSAFQTWNKALAQWTKFEFDEWNCDLTISETNDPKAGESAAWVDRLGGATIVLRKGWYEQDVEGIVMHEIGHILGAQHVPGTLMRTTWAPNALVCPDVTTVAQVAAFNRIDLRLLSWCNE